MKKLLLLILLGLTCCATKTKTEVFSNEDSPSVIGEHSYAEVESKKIKWDQIFNQTNYQYYCYIYSPTCSHCNDIKNEVISIALERDDFYFVEFDKKIIPISNDVTDTIGSTKVEEVSIIGTPSLLTINNEVLIENIAGSKKVIEKIRKI